MLTREGTGMLCLYASELSARRQGAQRRNIGVDACESCVPL